MSQSDNIYIYIHIYNIFNEKTFLNYSYIYFDFLHIFYGLIWTKNVKGINVYMIRVSFFLSFKIKRTIKEK